MIKVMIKRLRLARLKKAIAICERAGLAVVQLKHTDNAVYLVGSKGTYVRFDKAKA